MKRIVLFVALALAVLVTAWYVGLYRPETTHISNLRSQQAAEESSMMSLQTQYLVLLSGKKRIPKERAALAKLMKLVPNGPDLDSVEKLLFAAASRSGVRLDSITSPEPENFGAATAPAPAAVTGPAELYLTLGVTGTSSGIETFYRILSSDSRLFVIDNCSLSFASAPTNPQPGASALGGTSIEIRAFYASAGADTAAS
jgi:Tfp pilus assembly protein PilO